MMGSGDFVDRNRLHNSNWLLQALPIKEQIGLLSDLELVELPPGKILYEPGDIIDYIYFPHTAVISLLSIMANGAMLEIGMVGREGMLGLTALIGDNVTLYQMLVQLPGSALRINARHLNQMFQHSHSLKELLLRYTGKQLRELAQSVVCNRFHTLRARLCRYLLATQDRVQSHELQLTQDLLALMLGTRRASISVAAAVLQREGLISYARGHIKIIDRVGLEESACECYKIIKIEFQQLVKR